MSQKQNKLQEILHTKAAGAAKSRSGYEAYMRYLQREICCETGQTAHRVTNWLQNKSQPSVAEAKLIAEFLNLNTDAIWS